MHLVCGIPTSDVLIPAEKGKQGPGGAGECESGVWPEMGAVLPNNNKQQPQTLWVNITHFLPTCSCDTD